MVFSAVRAAILRDARKSALLRMTAEMTSACRTASRCDQRSNPKMVRGHAEADCFVACAWLGGMANVGATIN
jgi:hypothetical protein